MKRFLVVLPVLAVLSFSSCSEDTPKNEPEEQKEAEQRPLEEREPQVKSYIESLNEVIGEYMNVAENLLTTAEKLDKGELGYMETVSTSQNLLVSWNKISALEVEIEKTKDRKSEIEENLNPEDLIIFTAMYAKTIERFNELSKRIEESDLNKYLK